jgi:hypothetical protein
MGTKRATKAAVGGAGKAAGSQGGQTEQTGGDSQATRAAYNQYVKRILRGGGTPAGYEAWKATQGK